MSPEGPRQLNIAPEEINTGNGEMSAISFDPTQEDLLTEAAQALCAQVERILSKIKDDLLTDLALPQIEKVRLFAGAAKELWKENDGHRVKPTFDLNSLFPLISDIAVQFEYYNNNGEFQRVEGVPGGKIVLGLGALLRARGEEEFYMAQEDLMDVIYHETEHIIYWGSEQGELEHVENVVRYLANEGEIRAFAKQYAYRYSRLYPGVPFDLGKMRTLKDVRGVTNYFDSFADPAKQEKYRDIADVKYVHEQIVSLTAAGVEYFNDRQHTDSVGEARS